MYTWLVILKTDKVKVESLGHLIRATHIYSILLPPSDMVRKCTSQVDWPTAGVRSPGFALGFVQGLTYSR